ncbi:MAG: CAP domain-containing protein [Myxococcales bacterium]|nr:CAP domain-containing protein [Myxococcales bacterium]
MLRFVCLFLGLTVAMPAHAAPDEVEVLRQWNVLRADPPAFARHLEAWLPLFAGLELNLPTGRLLTREGPAAVREAIQVLKASKPLPAVQSSAGMTRAAREHATDLGPRGGRGHTGADGSTVGARLDRRGQWQGVAHEAISFGATNALNTIIELLVDDGVASRGHRAVLLFAPSAMVGVACGSHQQYRSMCVLDLASEFVEARPPGPPIPPPADVTPFDDSKPFRSPVPRTPADAPTPFDVAVATEINALRTDPVAWAAKLEALLPLFSGPILRRPGRTAMHWSGAPESVHQAIAMLKTMPPQPAAQFLPGLAAGARDYVKVRRARPAFIDRHYGPTTAARRYGAGPLGGAMTMQGEGEPFDIVATWVVQGRGPNRTLLATDGTQMGVACGPGFDKPLLCALIYGARFSDYNAAELELIQSAHLSLDAARTEPKREALRLRKLLSVVMGETLRLPIGVRPLPGGREALLKLVARLESASSLAPLQNSVELQARARDFTAELASGRLPNDPGSWAIRTSSNYGQPDATPKPNELAIFAPGEGDQLALRILLQQPDWILSNPELGVGLWCGSHASKGQVCVLDAAVGWQSVGAELPW